MGMAEEGREHDKSVQPQQNAVALSAPNLRTDPQEAVSVRQPAVVRKCGRGVKVAQSKKASRRSPARLAREYKEVALTLQAHGGPRTLPPLRSDSPVALPSTACRGQKPGCTPATTSSVSPVAAALRPPHNTADTDVPLVSLARRVTIQSHRCGPACSACTGLDLGCGSCGRLRVLSPRDAPEHVRVWTPGT